MSDQFATLNGNRIISCRITIPNQGAWSADVILATSELIPSNVILVVGDLKLVGTVVRMASFSGSRSARIVGGGAGWRKVLKSRSYSNITGVRLQSILNDAARESGENMAPFSDKSVGTNYVRDKNPAEYVLRYWAPNWWIDTDGKTHVEPRKSTPILSLFTVESWSGGKGLFEISTEKVSDWVPGRTFSSPTVTQEQTISQVSIEMNNDGKLRLQVLNGSVSSNRIVDDIRSIVSEELSTFNFMGIYEYKVAKSSETTIDASPIDIHSPLPPVTNVSALFGCLLATPEVNDNVSIVFLDGNPTKPRWLAPLNASNLRLESGGQSATEHVITLESVVVILHNYAFALATLGLPALWLTSGAIEGALNLALAAASVPAPPGKLPQIAAAASIAASMASAPGNTSLPYAAAITMLSNKTPDESGLFPQLGCPKVQGG